MWCMVHFCVDRLCILLAPTVAISKRGGIVKEECGFSNKMVLKEGWPLYQKPYTNKISSLMRNPFEAPPHLAVGKYQKQRNKKKEQPELKDRNRWTKERNAGSQAQDRSHPPPALPIISISSLLLILLPRAVFVGPSLFRQPLACRLGLPVRILRSRLSLGGPPLLPAQGFQLGLRPQALRL